MGRLAVFIIILIGLTSRPSHVVKSEGCHNVSQIAEQVSEPSRVIVRFSRRLIIWLFALFIAFFIPVKEFGLTWPLASWIRKVSDAGKFSDVMIAALAMSMLSVSNIIDQLVFDPVKTNDVGVKVAGLWVMFIQIGVVLIGLVDFSTVALPLTDDEATHWFGGLVVILVAGLAAELFIAIKQDAAA